MKRLVSALFVAIVVACGPGGVALAAPGPADLDLKFGVRGFAPGGTFASHGQASIAVGAGGEIAVLEPNHADCDPFGRCASTLRVARYLPDGARDPVFGAEAKLEVTQNRYERSAIAVGEDGRVVVAARDDRHLLLARFGLDGRLDPSFGVGGIVVATAGEAAWNVPAVAVGDDGSVVLAQEVSGGDAGRVVVSRFRVDGGPDLGFGASGSVALNGLLARPAAIAEREGGGYELGLSRCCRGEGGAAEVVGLARISDIGALDPSLAGSGRLELPRPDPTTVQSIALGPAGAVFLAVEEERRGSVLMRLHRDGGLDRGFGLRGEVRLLRRDGVPAVVQIAVDGAGRVVGVSGRGTGVSLFRVKPDGSRDRTFAAGGQVFVRRANYGVYTSGFGLQGRRTPVAIVESGVAGARTYELARLVGGSSRVRCMGKRATIVGTREDDEILGTKGRDVIAALGGRDTVRGLSGRDLICGGKGRDKLFGGPGQDRVRQ